MIDRLADKGIRDRSHIALDRPDQVKFWIRHFGITADELQSAIAKVGNAASAVQKELGRPSRSETDEPGVPS
jgi:hypothetical protein